MDRVRPLGDANERSMLIGWLRWQHATVEVKCAGLSDADARRAPLPTSPLVSVSGVVSHLTSVERDWLEGSFLGDETVLESSAHDGWEIGGRSLGELLDGYRRQTERSTGIIAEHQFDELEAYAPRGLEVVSLRWIVTHLIEETGRHLGHIDLLRELADGVRGQ